MNIYNYNNSGVYLGVSEAMPNPLEVGEYLIPAKATTTAPPSVGVDEVAVFDTASDTWTIVENHIGKEGYLNDEPYTVMELGALPLGFTVEKPLAVFKQEKLAELHTLTSNTALQGITELGVKVRLEQSTLAYLASIALLNSADNVIHDSDDIYHTGLTNANVVQILQVALNAYHALVIYKKDKELEIENATSQAELEAIVIGNEPIVQASATVSATSTKPNKKRPK